MPRVFNKGKRTFTYAEAIKDENGVITDDGRLAPEQQKSIGAEQAEKLKRLYPGEIVNLDDSADLQGQFGATGGVPTISIVQAEAEKKAAVDAAVAAALAVVGTNGVAADGGTPGGTGGTGGTGTAGNAATAMTEEEKTALIEKLDGMDRPGIIAFIEESNLAIEHKSKPMDKLKGEVLKAVEQAEAEKKAA